MPSEEEHPELPNLPAGGHPRHVDDGNWSGPSSESRRAQRELLAAALGSSSAPPEAPQPGTPFGDYVLERELGRGAFGVVFLARHAGITRYVALKRLRDGELATDAEVRRFLQGAAAAAELDHPNIVPVFHVGERGHVPFFTMRYVRGKNLAEAIEHERPSRRDAVRWTACIARAVQHAHDHGLIHLDLKPANILLDEAGEPHVTDFGLARRLDGAGSMGRSDGAAGAPYYMAPEQLTGSGSGLTVRTDVYALGVILYELLTGQVPYAGLGFGDWIQALVSSEPVPSPRQLDKRLSHDLDAICMRALAKDPEHRYRSALALAEDLECVLEGKPPASVARAGLPRLGSLLRRHRVAIGILLWGCSFAAAVGSKVGAAARADRDARAQQARENAAMASVQAVAFRFQLLEYAHRVARIARYPEVVALLKSDHVARPSPLLVNVTSGFGTGFVMGRDGKQRARTTYMPDAYMERSFAFRDYFHGAAELALTQCSAPAGPFRALEEPDSAYVARAHLSESDGVFEIAISAPICEAGQWLGILGVTLPSNKAFGRVRLTDGEPVRISALLGPRDVDRKDIGRPLPDGLTFVAHPGLTPGREYQLGTPKPAHVRAALGLPAPGGELHISGDAGELRYVAPLQVVGYVDPLPGYAGAWSAAIAPVEQSGFVVLVQSPEVPLRTMSTLLLGVLPDVALPFAVGLGLIFVFGFARPLRPGLYKKDGT